MTPFDRLHVLCFASNVNAKFCARANDVARHMPATACPILRIVIFMNMSARLRLHRLMHFAAFPFLWGFS